MADTSKLNKVTEYILECYSEKLGIKLKKGKVAVGNEGIKKQFSGVSQDKNTIVQVSHHSGATSSGNIPVGKLNGLFAKCYLLEKTNADNKIIVFTNKEFLKIFKNQSAGILDESIELEYYGDLPTDLELILNNTLKKASEEMK